MSRKVIFIRGPQGSGKTTLMRRAGLEGFNLNLDKIRNVLGGDMLNPNGQFIPCHEYEKMAFDIFRESLLRRIDRGEVVCIDGTLASGALLAEHWKLFSGRGYDGLVVDLYEFDPDLSMSRNMARTERERVPEASIARMRQIYNDDPMPDEMRADPRLSFLEVRDDDEAAAAKIVMTKFLKDRRCTRDLSDYDRVVHIGDLQGCFAPIMAEGSPLKDGLDPKTFYVFLGDLFDRGPQNGEVGRWFVDDILGKPNVALIAGNHEDYVEMQARAGKSDIGRPQSEWQRFSWPQLKEQGVTPGDCARIAEMAQDFLAYKWRGKEVLCSHAGFGKWPHFLSRISTHQMRRGNGHYDVDVDQAWSEAEAQTGRFQVHGHRNSGMGPVMTSPLSMNLEGQIEFGGHLRIVTLDQDGFTPTEIRSTVHRTMQRDIEVNQAIGRNSASRHAPLAPWIERGEGLPKVSEETLEKLHDHSMISLKDSASFPGVYSVNFTHAAFNNAAWDDYTTVARGLYLDGELGTVVARSYEKFFNLGERPETQPEAIVQNAAYPVRAYDKLNGFLGITGFSERHASLVVASKSVTEGEFPAMAWDVLEQEIGKDGMERLMRFNRDQMASCIFEIEDPVRDPHIITLERPKATLLAVVRRSEEFEQVPYETLVKIGKWLGCPVKRCLAVLPNDRALAAFNNKVQNDPNWGINGERSEGCVMEDADGRFYKLKSHYYRNWKRMRSAANHIRKGKLEGKESSLSRYQDVEAPFSEFLKWAQTLSPAALENDIVALRASFEEDRSIMENVVDTRAEEQAAREVAARSAHFEQLIGQIATNEKISDVGVAKFVKAALQDEEKAAILRAHECGKELLERAGLASRPESFEV